jgi:hypothetical protein
MSNMLNQLIRKLFFSNLFRTVRIKYYKEAYEQGRFDERMDSLYKIEELKE